MSEPSNPLLPRFAKDAALAYLIAKNPNRNAEEFSAKFQETQKALETMLQKAPEAFEDIQKLRIPRVDKCNATIVERLKLWAHYNEATVKLFDCFMEMAAQDALKNARGAAEAAEVQRAAKTLDIKMADPARRINNANNAAVSR